MRDEEIYSQKCLHCGKETGALIRLNPIGAIRKTVCMKCLVVRHPKSAREMKETGIIMSGNHPQKVLEGLKTQTRRTAGLNEINENPDLWEVTPTMNWNVWAFIKKEPLGNFDDIIRIKCPYGQVGDRLWVRETWQDYCPIWSGAWCGHGTKEGIAKEHQPVYKADSPDKWLRNGTPPLKWKPSIFMPKWATRIWLEITGLRAERVQDISEADAGAEGVTSPCILIKDKFTKVTPIMIEHGETGTLRLGFGSLWDSLNAERGHGWDRNDRVWVITFKLLTG